MNTITQFGNQDIIVCGDFNLVQDPDLDYYNYLHINNPNARLKVLNIMNECNLIDPYRELYPSEKKITWRKSNKRIKNRFFCHI